MLPEKENFQRVLRRDNPSHVPCGGSSRAAGYAGAWPGDLRPDSETMEWRDEWSVLWADRDGEIFPVGPAVESSALVERIQPPDPNRPDRMDALRKQAGEMDRERYFLAVNHPYFLYEKAINILGPAEFACAMVLDKENAHRLLDMIVGFELGIARRYAGFRPDHVNLMDDYGHQDRLAMSPECWREFFKPRIRRVVDFYRGQFGDELTISQHSCGHIMPLLEDFMELGINVFHPVQSTANDLAEVRRVTSGRLTLAGAIDGQQVLPLGTPDEVRGEVFQKLDLLWEGGGYLPMAEKQLGVPEQNLRAMEDAIREWSRENVEN